MLYTEDIERAGSIAIAATEKMGELSIPANPMNFTVWYAYIAGTNPDLNQAIDVVITNKLAFTPARNEEIFGKFFGFDDDGSAIQQTSGQIQSKVDEVVRHMNQASADNSDFGIKLGHITEGLVDDCGPDDVAKVVRDMLLETQDIVAKSKTLEDKLAASSKEISFLREHLETVRHEAMTDSLTGLANRKCFDQRLREEATKAMEEGCELCLLLADIDLFKKFNDTYGHAIGDSVLKVVAKNLRDGVKGRDLPARYGGEEFCVILPETGMENAAKLADHIRARLAKKELKNSKTDESYGTVTLSVGVACYRFGEPLTEFVKRADVALYQAKDSGRNCVVTEDQLQPELGKTG